jgi:hypothetical protein
MTTAVRKYLERWAEPEARIADRLSDVYENVLVVPACREEVELLDGIRPAARGADGRTLVILVVNAPRGASPATVAGNERLLADLRRRPHRGLGENAFRLVDADFDLFVVDRASPGHELPAKQGVGLARKIGCDLALRLHASGRPASPWIHTSDADAEQPPDRFSAVAGVPREGVVALTHPFCHHGGGDPALDEATRLYELSLHYWVRGLAWAGSPYAFHTVGSTLGVRADAYAQVRGFPRRCAGEDFYVLNKLAKIGAVARPRSRPVRIRGRLSDRVPFGTGPATARILKLRARGEELRVYDPRSYELLRRLLVAIAAFSKGADLRPDTSGLDPGERTALVATIDALGVGPALARIRDRHGRSGNVLRPLHTWFDAFRTLKFVHGVRDRGLPEVEWKRARRELERMGAFHS